MDSLADMMPSITVVILTYNEAPNLARTLHRLEWVKQVLILDSGSADGSAEIAQQYANVQWHVRAFDTHSAQWNAAVALAETDWILSLDADYVLSAPLVEELRAWRPDGQTVAWYIGFRYCIFGRPLRASLYPDRAALFDRRHAHYCQEGHTQMLQFSGPSQRLVHPIEHDDRKSLARWIQSQQRYAQAEADYLMAAEPSQLRWRDRLRRMGWPAPFVVLAYTLLVRGALWEGKAGWYYSLQRFLAEVMLALTLWDQRLRPDAPEQTP